MVMTAGRPPSGQPDRSAAGLLDRSAAALGQQPVGAMAPAVLPPHVALRRSRLGEYVALAGLTGFGALFVLVKLGRTSAFDAALTLRIQGRRHRTLDAIMAAASWPGFPPQSRMIPPTIIGALFTSGLRLEALAESVAWGSALVSTVVKGFMGRARPVAGRDLRVVAAPLGGSSFPSGHVLTFLGTYGFLAFLADTLVRPELARRTIVIGLIGLIALVGPSRIQQGHHWPTDVTASYLLGTSYLIGVIALYRAMKARTVSVEA
jgi:undecaprenyl-diphosphatase